MPLFDTLVLFVFGTIVGSFLNALSFRYKTGKSMWGRSECLSCGKTLHAQDLIPILSYLFLGGKCRFCRSNISFQYPLVEVVSGILLLLTYTAQPDTGVFFLTFTFFMLLLFIAVYDFRHTIIPDSFVVAAAIVALLVQCQAVGWHITNIDPYTLFAGPLLAFPIALIWFVSKGKAMGLGDAKLFLACGWFLGLLPGIAAFMLSFWIGAIASLLLLALLPREGKRRVTMKSEIPFGPYITLATAIVYFAHIDVYTIFSIF